VFTTASTDEKVRLCQELGAHVAMNYNTRDFAEIVLHETDNEGADVVFDNVGEAVMEKSLQCTKYNGRYLMMGFASDKAVADEKFLVPRRIALGNLKLCGVLLSYQDQSALTFLKTGMGWNFLPRELGSQIMDEIISLVRSKRVRPVVGRVVDFDEIPSAIDAMARRETVGRTIAMIAEP
jgi:NADPH2:quinone reductase